MCYKEVRFRPWLPSTYQGIGFELYGDERPRQYFSSHFHCKFLIEMLYECTIDIFCSRAEEVDTQNINEIL